MENRGKQRTGENIDSLLGQHRTIRQEPGARDFFSAEPLENRGILGVFPVFQTARMGETTRHPAADAIVRCCPKYKNLAGSGDPRPPYIPECRFHVYVPVIEDYGTGMKQILFPPVSTYKYSACKP